MFAPESKRDRRIDQRRTGRRPAIGRGVEALEPRELLTLTVASTLDLTQFVPFNGSVATFGPNDVANPLTATATIAYGNIATASGTIVADNDNYDVVTAPETFSIIDPSLPVTVTVVGSNTTLTAAGTADIAESPLTPTTVQFSATAGEAFNGVVGSFLDNNPNGQPGDFAATINWGDNSTTPGTITPVGTSTPQRYEVSGVHTYATAVPANVSITVQRIAGGAPQSAAPEMVVVNPPIQALSATSFTATANVAFNTTVATFTASNASDVAGNFSATVNWGDSSTPTTATITPISGSAGQFAVIAGHTYAMAQPYTTSITVALNAAPALFRTASGSINVAAGASPSAFAEPLTAVAGVPFTGLLGTFIDQADTTAADYSASFTTPNIMRTSASIPQITSEGNGLFEVNGTVTFNTVGTYSDKLTITPPQGAPAFAGTSTVTVMPAQYSAVGTPITATVGAPLTNVKVATLTDNTPGAMAGDYTATITWGSGLTTTQATIVPDPSGGGMFDVEGSFTYTTAGPNTATVVITRTLDSQMLTVSVPVTVNPASLVVSAVPPLTATAGIALNTTVATFTDNASDPVGNDTAAIMWGDGLATTQGTIVADPKVMGQFDVQGAFTYPTTGAFNVSVTVSRSFPASETATASTAVTVNGQLNAVPIQALTATVGQQFSGQLITLADATAGMPSNFTATIDWGDGSSPTMGSVITVTPPTTGTPPYLAVVGTHTYMQQTGNYPITYGIKVEVTRTASGQGSSATVAIAVYEFTAAIKPTSAPPGPAGAIVTNEQEPTLLGMAQPGATIALTFRRVGGGDPVSLGETQANANGLWSLVVGPLGAQPIHVFAIVTPPNGPPTQSIELFGGSPLSVLQHPVRFFKAIHGPKRDQLKVAIARADATGPDPLGLTQTASYTLVGPDGRKSTPVAVSVAPLNPKQPMAHRSVTLTFSPAALSRQVAMTLIVSFTGVANPGGSAMLRLRGGRG